MGAVIQSVTRALHILNTLSTHSSGLTNQEIAQQLGLNASTTHHLVNTLVSEGYAQRLDSGKYHLGHTVAHLYSAYRSSISIDEYLRTLVDRLAKLTEETAYLCVWQNGSALIQAIVEGSHAVRVGGLYVGFMGNTHMRASGKVLLAYLDRQERDAYLATADFRPLTSQSVRDRVALENQLREIVECGYAIDRGEFAEGVNCASAPVRSFDGKVVSALTVSSPESRFNENENQLVAAVLETARDASWGLGYRPGE